MFNLDDICIDIYCPKCKHQFEIQIIDARLESKVYCHNCKYTIQPYSHCWIPESNIRILQYRMNNINCPLILFI